MFMKKSFFAVALVFGLTCLSSVGEDAHFQELASLGAELSKAYMSEDDPWKDSPFAWLKERPSRQVGAIGERLIEQWLESNGIDVTRSPDSDADRIVAGHRAEIKLSTLWTSGRYKFQQLRNQDYEFAILMGISPHDAHCWVIPKADLLRLWKDEHVIRAQHNSGHGGADTAWVDVDPLNPPEWIHPFGGSLEEALQIIRTLIAPVETQDAGPVSLPEAA